MENGARRFFWRWTFKTWNMEKQALNGPPDQVAMFGAYHSFGPKLVRLTVDEQESPPLRMSAMPRSSSMVGGKKCVWENESEHECAHTHTHVHTHKHTHTHIQTYSDLLRLNLTLTFPLTFTFNVLTHEKNAKKIHQKIQKKRTFFLMHTLTVLWDSKVLFLGMCEIIVSSNNHTNIHT